MTTLGAPVITAPALLHEDGIYRDAVRQPLYSTVGINGGAAIPQELVFFNYGKGQNVPGTGDFSGVPSTAWHTNMESGGLLPRPKKFRCDGLRFHMPAIASSGASNTPALSDTTFGAAAVDSDLLEDLLAIFFSCYAQLRIGEKWYANHPLWMMPSNVGFDGLAAVAQDNGTAATTGSLDVLLAHLAGEGMGIHLIPFLIESQQSVQLTLRCPWTSPSLVDDRALTAFLTGNLYREVA